MHNNKVTQLIWSHGCIDEVLMDMVNTHAFTLHTYRVYIP